MIKFKKVDFDVALKNIDTLGDVIKKYDDKIIVAYLFGSVNDGNINALSDIDIAILFKEMPKEDIINLEFEVSEDISKHLKTEEIDLVNLNFAPLSVRYGVIKNKKILYYSDKQKAVDFEFEVIKSFLDFKPIRDMINLEFVKGKH
ncbi:type VII toxin-antitoxin system MntA family adenylyltransferase antitoxin [Caloramator sp. Dgby_cultured_2]|uniref:type VII toxin-antitoxin system MntA family adenylyltransferase antitoxin n=1 Tax=Caloramator sp. Dgby_cultured_2 TaxID=3029174 RepID=UPI00237E593E|nr:nucleotidyltransferase domain-containing protein [Caloramator sp. Dgby_cultured_2]WDU82687.1 nucleotidyltransferase domain-containing protein [Caloramator sp. Dgby_cultured_2]